jgi:hypothetical protein
MRINGNTITAHQVRKAIFTAVPEWKKLRRVSVTVYSMSDHWRVEIRLMTGLLDDETVSVFDKTGTLGPNSDRIAEKVSKMLDGPDREVTIDGPYQHRDHRFTFLTLIGPSSR